VNIGESLDVRVESPGLAGDLTRLESLVSIVESQGYLPGGSSGGSGAGSGAGRLHHSARSLTGDIVSRGPTSPSPSRGSNGGGGGGGAPSPFRRSSYQNAAANGGGGGGGGSPAAGHNNLQSSSSSPSPARQSLEVDSPGNRLGRRKSPMPQQSPVQHHDDAEQSVPDPGQLLAASVSSSQRMPADSASAGTTHLPLRWNPDTVGSGFRLRDGELTISALSSYLQTALGTLVIDCPEPGSGAGGAVHEWRLAIDAAAVCTWVGVAEPDADVYSFMGRGRSALALSSAGTVLENGRITTRRGGRGFGDGDTVGVRVDTAERSMTVSVNGAEVARFEGIPARCVPAVSMPHPGCVRVLGCTPVGGQKKQ
jgi:hypothetical protein